MESFLVGIVDSITPILRAIPPPFGRRHIGCCIRIRLRRSGFLPPESFQRRNNIIKITVNLMIAFLTHLDRKSYSIQKTYRLFIITILLIRIPHSAHSDIIHARYRHDTRSIFRHVKLFIFLLEIKSHLYYLPASFSSKGLFHEPISIRFPSGSAI